MSKTITYTLASKTFSVNEQFVGENLATQLILDFTDCGVDGFAKWVKFRLPNGVNSEPIYLGVELVETYDIPVQFLQLPGALSVFPYAISATNVTVGFPIKTVTVNPIIEDGATVTYDPTQISLLQAAISDMGVQVDQVYDAYMAGEFDATLAVGTVSTGVPGTSVIITNSGTNHDAIFNFTIPKGDTGAQGIQGFTGASPITAGFVGNDMVFTKDDTSTITLVGAKLLLKGDTGNTGATGATGATIVSGSFVGNDMVFVKSDSSTVTLVGAKTALKGDQGIQGVIGLTGAQGIQGESATITIGTVTTGNAGTSASVVNAGTINDAVLNFTIPRGDVGESGVYVGTTEPTDPDHIVWIDTDGTPDIVAEDVVELTSGNETVLHKHNATNTPFTPTGNLSSTNVQNALAELDIEKAGKLFATNIVTNGDFSNGTTGWTGLKVASFTVSNNEASFLGNGTWAEIRNLIFSRLNNNIYYIMADVKADTTVRLSVDALATSVAIHSGSGNYERLSRVFTSVSSTSSNVYISDIRPSGWTNVFVKNVNAINLTTLFGAGNEPTKEQMDWIFTERDRLGLGHLNGTTELLPMVSLLNLINDVQSITDEKARISLNNMRIISEDFGGGFSSGALNGGTIATAGSGFTNFTSGQVTLKSSVNANSGYRYYQLGVLYAYVKKSAILFCTPITIDANTVVRFGYLNSVDNVTPANGVYLEMLGNQICGVAMKAGVKVITSAFTLTSNTYYRFTIEHTGTSYIFKLFSLNSDTVLLSETISTNLLTSGTDYCALVAYNTGTAIKDLLFVDYIGFIGLERRIF